MSKIGSMVRKWLLKGWMGLFIEEQNGLLNNDAYGLQCAVCSNDPLKRAYFEGRMEARRETLAALQASPNVGLHVDGK